MTQENSRSEKVDIKSPPNDRVRRLFSPPTFSGIEQTQTANLLNALLLIMIGATFAAVLSVPASQNRAGSLAAIGALLAVEAMAYILLHRGLLRASAILLTIGSWLILVTLSVITGGFINTPFVALVVIIAIAGLLLGGRTGFVFAVMSSLAGLGFLLVETIGIPPKLVIPFSPTGYWISISVIFIVIAGLIYVTTKNLQEAISQADRNAKALETIQRELMTTRESLEEQIAERTLTLEQRSRYLEASIEVSRATASILDIDLVFQQAVDLICQRFELYYVGIFLRDPASEWAVLRAGTGEAGKAMLARGHRIRVGEGMVGWCIANAQPRITQEASQDQIRLHTIELPDTRSEAAIPLRSRGRILGALTVQSDQPNAFNMTEIAAFQALADQVAIAFDNAQLYKESQILLDEARRAYSAVSSESWQTKLRSSPELSYRYDHNTLAPISATWLPEMQEAFNSGEIVDDEQTSSLFIPITVRDQRIGVLKLMKENTHLGWTKEDIKMLETITEQLAVALESARLYEETRRRAERERLTSEITAKVRASNDPQVILQTAASELRRALQAQRTQVLLQTSRPQTNLSDPSERDEAMPDSDLEGGKHGE